MRMPTTSDFEDDIAIVSAVDRNPAPVISAPGNGPAYIKPGTGGKVVVMPSGARITAGGELLRIALLNGGVIVGAKPVETFQRKADQFGRNIE